MKSRSAATIHNASDDFRLISVEVLDNIGKPTEAIDSGDALRIKICFELKIYVRQPEIVVGTHTTDFFYLTAASTAEFEDRPDYPPGMHEIEYSVDSFPLVGGSYCVRFIFFDEFGRPMFQGETLKIFSVRESKSAKHESGWLSLQIPTSWIMGGKVYVDRLKGD
jgi:hypothetical protein